MSQSDEKKRRIRGKNFTDNEKDLLVDIIGPFKSVVDNVKTDTSTNTKKVAAWISITELYNHQQTSGERNDSQLKHLYDTLKRGAKKEINYEKVLLLGKSKTEDGTNNVHISKYCEKKNIESNLKNNYERLTKLTNKRLQNNDEINNDPISKHFEKIDTESNFKKIDEGLTKFIDKKQNEDHNTKYENEINEIKLKKAKTDLEISETRLNYEKEKLDSDRRQNKIKEEMLILELEQKKKIFGLN